MSLANPTICILDWPRHLGYTWHSAFYPTKSGSNPLTINTQLISIYCDNLAVIEQNSIKSSIQYPWDACNDYPIFMKINTQVQQLHPIIPKFHHVMGHQDNKSDKPLILPEILNVDCDQRASLLIALIHDPLFDCNPPMESGYPHLLINKCLIIFWLQHILWDAATSSNYCTYLAEKFQWPSTTEPHWKLFHYAQQCLNQPEHKFISKFIHKWLPLHNWYHIWSASANNLFPSCHTGKETMEHFLTCPHIDHRSLWCNLHDQLYKLHLENKIDGPLSWHPLPLTIFGLPGHTTQPILLLTDLLAPIYQAQDQLGWKQLYYGQFVKEWAVKLTAVSPQTNCMMFYSWALTLILKTVLLQWKLQNEHLHLANHCKDDCMQLQNIIYQILHDMHNDPLLHDFQFLWTGSTPMPTNKVYPSMDPKLY